jgi:hypothetical protein
MRLFIVTYSIFLNTEDKRIGCLQDQVSLHTDAVFGSVKFRCTGDIHFLSLKI